MTSAPRPVAADRLADEIAGVVDQAAAACSHVLRVAVDGHPAASPGAFADGLVDPLRLRGRQVLRVSTEWFLRPASLRFERGRTDPDSFYDDRLDVAGLQRELLDPLGPGGSELYLPTLWDPETDRATRAQYEPAPSEAVLILDGTLLLGHGLPIDLAVHLRLSAGARERRVAPDERWALPAYARYEREVDPERTADVLIRLDDPRHPALSFPTR
ncbi:MAG TPA: hypothetical protein VH573_02425 [Mycobacteriales bacterium]